MEEYYFLFAIGFIWTIFAVVQDFKTTEVSNWLNFSLVGIALGYRAFYASVFQDTRFFLLGLIGFGIFFVLAYGFYYMRAFAGGDAKLLMGYGVLLPYGSYLGLLWVGLGFVFVLFFIGALWSLFYSFMIIKRNSKGFLKEFYKEIKKWRMAFVFDVILLFLSIVLLGVLGWIVGIGIFVFTFLFVYVKVLDKSMLKKVKPGELMEGDWLEKDVKIRGEMIKKSVHGLSLEEIKMLRKAKKEVWIKQGIPFTPAFLIALLVMEYVFLVLGVSVLGLVSFLF